jgi:hypothetical protein
MKEKINDIVIDYRKSDKKIQKEIIKTARKAYQKNLKFFKRKPKSYRIQLVYSKQEMSNYFEGNVKWMIGSQLRNKIVIYSPTVIKKIINFKNISYLQILTHETSHIFLNNLYKTKKPFWMQEGIALNVHKYKFDKKKFLIKLKKQSNLNIFLCRYKEATFLKILDVIGPASYLLVKYLINNFGKSKILNFMNKYSKKPTKENFNKLFYRVYKLDFENLKRQLIENWQKGNF